MKKKFLKYITVALIATVALFTGTVISTGNKDVDSYVQEAIKVFENLGLKDNNDANNTTPVTSQDYSNTVTTVNGITVPEYDGQNVAGCNGSMLDYELQTVNYIEETGNHVRYRVTPIFENVDVTAKGVLMEAESIEDQGQGLKYCVWIYNVQPEYVCNYTTGIWEHVTTPELTEEAK